MAKLSNPYLLIGVLIISVLASGALCNAYTGSINATESINAVNGTTVVSGDLLIDNSNIKLLKSQEFLDKLKENVKKTDYSNRQEVERIYELFNE